MFCLVVDKDIIDMVWKPTIYIEKMKEFKLKKSHETVEDMGVEIHENSTKIFLYSEAEVTVSCPMRFAWFPFDKQTCWINIFELNLEPIEQFRLLVHGDTAFGSYYDNFQPAIREYDYKIMSSEAKTFSYANFNIEGMKTGKLIQYNIKF